MKRMVAYIYLYKKNNDILSKCENMGFCRVWQNGDRYVVNLCLKDSCGVKGTFYISILKKSEKDGRVVYCKNNIDICRTVVGGTINIKLEVEENDGIYMECGGRIYVTLWNESMKDIEIVEKTVDVRTDSNMQNVKKVDKSAKAQNAGKTRDNESIKNQDDIINDKKFHHKENEKQNNNVRKTELEQYTRIYNRLCKVRMILNETEYPAVKLKLHELMLLPRSCWRMANNIFLMESYYMYSHILFMQYRGKYILAVPCENKRGMDVMAKQCGFLEYVTGYEYGRKRDSKVYWIKEL